MKTFLAAAGAVILGYLILGEWLDEQDADWLDDSHRFEDGDTEFLAHLPHPWSRTS
jgi:hypothetical protein